MFRNLNLPMLVLLLWLAALVAVDSWISQERVVEVPEVKPIRRVLPRPLPPSRQANVEEFQIEGVQVGMTRSQVEAAHGAQPLGVLIDCNTKGFTIHTSEGKLRVAIGNHPEREVSEQAYSGEYFEKPRLTVAYGEDDRVTQVFGEKLSRSGKLMPLSLRVTYRNYGYSYGELAAAPRPGYCMAGPWAYLFARNQVEIMASKESPDQVLYGLHSQRQVAENPRFRGKG